MKKLYALKAAEVSAVDKGAVRKKFLVLKNQHGDAHMNKTKLAAIAKADPALTAKVETILKEQAEEMKKEGGALSEDAMTAAKAACRLLAPFKDELGPVAGELMKAAGMADEAAAPAPMVEKAKETPEEDHVAAQEVAKSAYLKAYQNTLVTMAGGKGGDPTVTTKESGMQPVIKADGSLDLAAVPESIRPSVEAVFKSNQEIVKKNAQLETELKAERDARLGKEFAETAATLKHVGSADSLVPILKANHALGAEHYGKFLETLKGANETVAKSAAFTEIGSGAAALKGGDSWAKIEQAVAGVVAKSAGAITQDKAMSEFLETDEGRKLYAAHKAERKEG